jgi:hypothetical protein
MTTNYQFLRRVKFSDLNDTAGLTKTLTCPAFFVGSGNGKFEHEDVLLDVRTAFAGTATLQLDVGRASLTERHAKDVDMKTAGETFGSATTNVKPRLTEDQGLQYLLTFTATVNNLTLLTAGEVDIHVKVGALPPL